MRHRPIAASLASLALFTAGCASAPRKTPATSVAQTTSAERRVYRLDFVLRSTDGAQPSTTQFTLNLTEGAHGEVMVGKNVALTSAPPTTGDARPPPYVRQDVGLKVYTSTRSEYPSAVSRARRA